MQLTMKSFEFKWAGAQRKFDVIFFTSAFFSHSNILLQKFNNDLYDIPTIKVDLKL